MEEIVRQAVELAVRLSDEAMDGLRGVEKSQPCGAGDFGRKGGGAGAPVKRVIAVPEGKPLVVVVGAEGADVEVGEGVNGHGNMA